MYKAEKLMRKLRVIVTFPGEIRRPGSANMVPVSSGGMPGMMPMSSAPADPGANLNARQSGGIGQLNGQLGPNDLGNNPSVSLPGPSGGASGQGPPHYVIHHNEPDHDHSFHVKSAHAQSQDACS